MADVIATAARLLEARATLQRFWGAEYAKRIQPARQLVLDVMKAGKLETLPAAIKCAKHFTDADRGFEALALLAAGADLVEGA